MREKCQYSDPEQWREEAWPLSGRISTPIPLPALPIPFFHYTKVEEVKSKTALGGAACRARFYCRRQTITKLIGSPK